MPRSTNRYVDELLRGLPPVLTMKQASRLTGLTVRTTREKLLRYIPEGLFRPPSRTSRGGHFTVTKAAMRRYLEGCF